ncbi:hypothetical protein QBC99_000697 [Beijerinckia sp. GAS462]|nr:hypothetical protein [Beijerinckia sp. GAS462]SEB69324.1 hypothetical protein SAMN05443249_0908 [Beijerinckia sp. 28-YEA-48]
MSREEQVLVRGRPAHAPIDLKRAPHAVETALGIWKAVVPVAGRDRPRTHPMSCPSRLATLIWLTTPDAEEFVRLMRALPVQDRNWDLQP